MKLILTDLYPFEVQPNWIFSIFFQMAVIYFQIHPRLVDIWYTTNNKICLSIYKHETAEISGLFSC